MLACTWAKQAMIEAFDRINGHKPATMGGGEVGQSEFDVFEAGPTKNPPVKSEGPKACDY